MIITEQWFSTLSHGTSTVTMFKMLNLDNGDTTIGGLRRMRHVSPILAQLHNGFNSWVVIRGINKSTYGRTLLTRTVAYSHHPDASAGRLVWRCYYQQFQFIWLIRCLLFLTNVLFFSILLTKWLDKLYITLSPAENTASLNPHAYEESSWLCNGAPSEAVLSEEVGITQVLIRRAGDRFRQTKSSFPSPSVLYQGPM